MTTPAYLLDPDSRIEYGTSFVGMVTVDSPLPCQARDRLCGE